MDSVSDNIPRIYKICAVIENLDPIFGRVSVWRLTYWLDTARRKILDAKKLKLQQKEALQMAVTAVTHQIERNTGRTLGAKLPELTTTIESFLQEIIERYYEDPRRLWKYLMNLRDIIYIERRLLINDKRNLRDRLKTKKAELEHIEGQYLIPFELIKSLNEEIFHFPVELVLKAAGSEKVNDKGFLISARFVGD